MRAHLAALSTMGHVALIAADLTAISRGVGSRYPGRALLVHRFQPAGLPPPLPWRRLKWLSCP